MHRTAKVQRGERILVQGAAGGVGSALLELGRLAGLEMYGTASSYNHEHVAALGATPIDYRNEDVAKRIHSLTNDGIDNGGVDVVFDPIGGDPPIMALTQCAESEWSLGLVWRGRDEAVGAEGHSPDAGHGGAAQAQAWGPTIAVDARSGSRQGFWYRQTLTELLDLLAKRRTQPAGGGTYSADGGCPRPRIAGARRLCRARLCSLPRDNHIRRFNMNTQPKNRVDCRSIVFLISYCRCFRRYNLGRSDVGGGRTI